jgi:hypothetical protein
MGCSTDLLVMRVEGAGNVLLNVPLIANMEVNYHQQKNIQFIGVNAKGEGILILFWIFYLFICRCDDACINLIIPLVVILVGPYKPGNYSLCFSVATEKEDMFKKLKAAIATAKPATGKTETSTTGAKEEPKLEAQATPTTGAESNASEEKK